MPYPIEENLSEVLNTLHCHNRVILSAPTGSGKSTVLPTMIHAHFPKMIWIIQPRRAAALLIAKRIATLMMVKLGKEVGYHIRHQRKYSSQTKILVMTEGMLLQKIQADPFLESVSLVILDEFHERSIELDLALGFLTEIQQVHDELKLLCMSATIAQKELIDYFSGQCGTIQASGRSHAVEISYCPVQDFDRWTQLADTISNVLSPEGNVLAFLPGIREIGKVASILFENYDIIALKLYGQQSIKEQQDCLRIRETGHVILSTNIAESSVTIPNITSVVDSGLQKIAIEEEGIPTLYTVEISQASADQRAGRAGRTQNGNCYRLWSKESHFRRPPQQQPEILRCPLDKACLQILQWGAQPQQFQWITPPPSERIKEAIDQLESLGAIQKDELTQFGRQMASIPANPKIAALLLKATQANLSRQGAALATLLSEGLPKQRIQSAEDCLASLVSENKDLPYRWQRTFQQLLNLPSCKADKTVSDISFILSSVLPERIARHIGENRYQCGSGKQRRWRNASNFPKWIFAISVVGDQIFHAVPVIESQLSSTQCDVHRFDRQKDKVFCWDELRIGEIILRQHARPINPDLATELLFNEAALQPERCLTIDKDSHELLGRLRFGARCHPELPTHQTWNMLLSFLCNGRRSFSELRQLKLSKEILRQLSWSERELLNRVAPEQFQLPNGRSIKLKYPEQGPPIIATYIQQLFCLKKHPVLGDIPLSIHLWAPNGRTQQQTTDIESFWVNTYPEIRKELRGRYPKHNWPEPKDLF